MTDSIYIHWQIGSMQRAMSLSGIDKSLFKIVFLFFFIFGLLIWSGFIFPLEGYSAQTGRPKRLYLISRHVQYSFTLTNRTHKAVKDVHFWTYAPVKQTPSQKCDKLESSYPYDLILDEYSNQILHYSFESFAPYSSKVITVDAYLNLSDSPNRFPTNSLAEYLLPEKHIESDHPEMIATAQQLKKNTTLETAGNIFQWIVNNLSCPGYVLHERGALYALNNKKGDCTEYMYLFAALCRAERIPSRCLGGYVCTQDSILQFNRYHNWSEFYYDDTWRLADPHKNVFLLNQAHYIAFKIIKRSPRNPIADFSRFHVQGSGIDVKMN